MHLIKTFEMSIFGAEVAGVFPAVTGDSQPLTDFGRKLLQDCRKVKKPVSGPDEATKLMAKSEEFPLDVSICEISMSPLISANSPLHPVWR